MSQLQVFIEHARNKELSDADIKQKLLAQGWDEVDVDAALDGLEVPKPPSAADSATSETPQKAHPSIGALAAALQHVFLYFFSISMVTAIFGVSWALFGYSDDPKLLATFTAVFLITGTVYLTLYIHYLRKALKPPYTSAHKVWSIITICLHGIGAIGALISLVVLIINSDGGSSYPGILTASLIIMLYGAIVATYVAATFLQPGIVRKLILVGAIPTVVVLFIIPLILALSSIGNAQHDETLRKDLVTTTKAIRTQIENTKALPTDADTYITGSEITYTKKSDTTYELCGTFKFNKKNRASYAPYYSGSTQSISDTSVATYDFENTGSGNQCFTIRTTALKSSDSIYNSYDYTD